MNKLRSSERLYIHPNTDGYTITIQPMVLCLVYIPQEMKNELFAFLSLIFADRVCKHAKIVCNGCQNKFTNPLSHSHEQLTRIYYYSFMIYNSFLYFNFFIFKL